MRSNTRRLGLTLMFIGYGLLAVACLFIMACIAFAGIYVFAGLEFAADRMLAAFGVVALSGLIGLLCCGVGSDVLDDSTRGDA